MHTARTIDEWNGFLDFWRESAWLELKSDAPDKGQEFYLFRGENDSVFDLESSLTRFVRDSEGLHWGKEWRGKIVTVEKDLLNRFLDEIEPCSALGEQYSWFNRPNLKTETFWYLSVMRHHGCPTRLVDFTADFWAAIFFAVDSAKNGVKPTIYRLKCKNEDAGDKGGNKAPKDCDGKPWRDFRDVDINDLLGQIIGYRGFEASDSFWERSQKWRSAQQQYGWDTPSMQNARVKRQKGFFVYNLDVTRTLQEDIGDSSVLEKLSIDDSLVPKIKEELCKREYNDLVLYLDLDRTFRKWAEQLRAKR